MRGYSRAAVSRYFSKRTLSIAVLAASLTLALGVLTVATPGESCADQDIQCWSSNANRLLKSGDTRGAFIYATEIVYAHNRSAEHGILHRVGQQAYKTFGGLSGAIALLPQDGMSDEKYLIYEGYIHGVEQAYFKTEKVHTSAYDLIENACGTFLTPQFRDYSVTEAPRDGRQCFHGAGHALMFAYGNDLRFALEICGRIPTPWASDRCAYGAFMENTYLYSPLYEIGAPRPYAIGKNILHVCESLSSFKEQCLWYVGRSYRLAHPDDFAGAFKACDAVKPHDGDCRQEMVAVEITDTGGDLSSMKDRCSAAGPYEEECVIIVGRAVRDGFAGTLAQEKGFCPTLAEPLRSTCQRGVDASKPRQGY